MQPPRPRRQRLAHRQYRRQRGDVYEHRVGRGAGLLQSVRSHGRNGLAVIADFPVGEQRVIRDPDAVSSRRVLSGDDGAHAEANTRTIRALKARPVDLIDADKAAMLALPPLAPPVGLRLRIRLPRDNYVRVFGNDYSVDPVAIGRLVDVVADLDQVTVHLGVRLVAQHPRSWGNALTITDPDHVTTAARLREAFGKPRPVPDTDEVVLRDIAVYDTAFGVDLDTSTDTSTDTSIDIDIEEAS